MIVTCSIEGDNCHITSEGHAKTPEVCSAVSALMQTLHGWLHNSEATILREKISPGKCDLLFTGETYTGNVRCQTAFEVIAVGFLRLQATAPDELTVILSDKTMRRIINADTDG